jgi:putative ATP-binding cassette transporter
MRLLSFVVRHARRTFALALLAGVISGAANVAFLAVINDALRGGSLTKALMWGFAGLCLALPLTRFVSESLLARFGQGALFELRMQLGRQVLATPLRHIEEVGTHKLMAAFTDDLVAITNALLIIPVISINAAVVLCALLYMGWLSGWFLLMVLCVMVLGILTYNVPMTRAQKYLRLAREDANKLLNHLRALTDGTKELKLHHGRRESFLEESFRTTADSFRQHNVAGLTIYTAAASWGQVLVFIVIGLVLFALPLWRPMSVETLTGYSLALLYLMNPLQVIINMLPGIGRANIALKKIDELQLSLVAQPTDISAATPPAPSASWGSIELEGITHAYRREGDDSSFVLGPIDFTLRQGELVFVVGGNGSGKTTLSKLLVGLYSPEAGQVYLDGKPVTDETREAYRQYFSVVFSDFYLFENLVGLDSPQLDARAREYLNVLDLAHKVEIKGGALSTTSLSQGQRKRLALLTAYLEDRPIYLFDEWAADQDPHFKEVFYFKLLPELKSRGKTVVVISHDDRYFHVADRIVKLEYGRIVEQTSYEELAPSHDEEKLPAA